MAIKPPAVTVSPEQWAALERAAGEKWVNGQWMVSQRSAVRMRAPVDDPAILAQRAQQDAELASAEELLRGQALLEELARKVFNLPRWRSNSKPACCAVTGEEVPAGRGLLVQQDGRWVVYSRRGVLEEIKIAAAMSHDLQEEAR